MNQYNNKRLYFTIGRTDKLAVTDWTMSLQLSTKHLIGGYHQ